MWEEAAEMEHAESAFELANVLLQEDEENPKILPYLKAAARQSHTEALATLGEWCLYGYFGVKKDQKNGMRISTVAAERGHVKALVSVANYLLRSRDGAEDHQKALSYLEIATNKGSSIAPLYLGGIYQGYTEGISRDYAKAAEYFQVAAERGEPAGLMFLGLMHKNQFGLPYDEEKIKTLLRQAGDAGESEAYFHLGIWLEGNGKPVLGGGYLFKSAMNGYEKAQRVLESRYSEGVGVFPLDKAKATYWLFKAHASGQK